MANVIRLKRASGSDPTASDLVSGEPAVRTDTGELFFKKDDGSVAKVSGAGGGPDFKYLALRNAANNGAASYPNADFTLVTSGTTSAITPTAANTLLVSVNGVIQKPNTGTSTPSQGFALSGSTIKFGANLSAAPDFILYQESGGIGEPSDETVSEEKLKVSNSPVNGYFLSAQSGNTGGLTWAAPVATSCTGNSATATALATARTINGTSFDGTANITVTAAAGTLTGNTLNSSVTASSLTSLGDLSGLTVTGNMAVDTNTLFVNATTNRVGIGTTSPDSILNLVGTGSDAATRISIKDGSAIANLLGRNGNLTFQADTDNVVNSSFISFESDGFERMRVASDGNLLIGGTSSVASSQKLQIFDDTDSRMIIVNTTAASSQNATLYFAPANSVTGASIVCTSEEDFSTSANRTSRLTFSTRKDGTLSEQMRIDSSGNVGIGTSSPTHPLDVHTSGTEIARFQGANNARLKLRNSTSNIFLAYTDSGDAFQLGTNGQNPRVHITSDGNVGIGTTSPDQVLHIIGTGGDTVPLRVESTGITSRIGFQASGTANSYNVACGAAAEDFTFYTGNTERMRIDSSGKVGFNNADPSAAIEVTFDSGGSAPSSGTAPEGIAISYGTADGKNGGIWFSPGFGDDQGISGISSSRISGYQTDLRFYTNNTNSARAFTERMRITNDGPHLLLGGTTDVNEITESSANAGMVIGGTGFGNAGLAIITSTSGTGRLYFGDNTGSNAGRNRGQINYGHSDDHMRFVTAGSERMRIDSAGAVRIGHSSFAADTGADNLIVGNTTSGANRGITILNHTGQDGRLCFGQSGDPDAGMIKYSHGSDVMQFFVESSEKMRISSNGDVDIADAVGQTHAAKLAVEHSGINPNAIFALSAHASFQGATLQSNASRNTTNGSYIHFKCAIHGVADKFRVLDNGNCANTNNSFSGLSDANLKENIVDVGSQWDDIKNIRVRKFNFKEGVDPEKPTLLGVIAQEAELVCPKLVESGIQMQAGEEKEYKSFKYSVLYMKAIKCLQEAIAKIETLEAKVEALEAK